MSELLTQARELQEEIIQNRRAVHGFAEVGFELSKTRDFVAQRLREYGYEPKLVGRCGLTALAGRPGPTILLRADMDALPMAEESGEAFAAVNGNCHSCGHDCHTAMLLGAAKLLKAHEEELPGQVKLMFQPAEELLSGARDMVESGILEEPKVDAAMCLHIFTGEEYSRTGTFHYIRGCVNNSGDAIRIRVHGKDGHGSRPELSVDAIHIAAHIVLALEELVAREIPTAQDAVVLVGTIKGGTTCNSVAGSAELEVSVRTTGYAERNFLLGRIEEIARGIAATFRGSAAVEHWYGVPPLVNDDTLLESLVGYLAELVGWGEVRPMPKLSSGEDFAVIGEQVPAVYLRLGVGSREEGYDHFVHHPAMRVNEETLAVGAAAYAQCAVRWLEDQAKALSKGEQA